MSFLKNITNSISSVFNTFKRPYHSSTLSFRGLLHSVAVAVAIFVFLFILQPFGLSEVNESEKTLTLAICGGIALGSMLFCQFVLPLLLKSFYDEQHWTGSKQLVQFLIMSAVVSMALNFYLNKVTGIDFPIEGLYVFAFSIIPLVLLVFIQESMHKNKFKQKAENLNIELKNKGVITSDNPLKVLVFKGATESLSLIPNQLIYAKIDSSVSEFYYQNPRGIDKTILTIDEKQVRDELVGHPQFVKFSVNLMLNTNAIQKVSGSARGYEIAIAKVNEEVKVSGKFRKNLENL